MKVFHGGLIAVFMALFTFIGGEFLKFPSGDQGLQIAWMNWNQNPGLYEGDPITIAFADYHSYLLRWLSPLSQSEAYPDLDRTLHFASLLALYGMLMWLAMSLFNCWPTAYWTVILAALIPLPALAGSPIINSQFVPSTIAIPLIIGALLAYYQSRWLIVGVTLGLTTLLHPLEGGVSFAALFLAGLIASKARNPKPLAVALAAYVIMAMPIIIVMLKAGAAAGGSAEWIEVLRWRSPHHIFPFSWSLGTWGRFALFAAAGGACFALWNRKDQDAGTNQITRSIYSLAVAVGLLALIGIVFTEFIPWAIVIKAQPLRGANLLVITAIPFLAFALLHIYRTIRRRFTSNDNPAAAQSLITAHHLPLVLVAMLFPVLALIRLNNDAERQIEFQSSLMHAQNWARENTLPEQRFLCLPPIENFRTLSRRPEFGSWKDGTLANFSPAYAAEWRRRMELLGMMWTAEFKGYRGAEALAKLWERPTAEQVRRVLDAEPCDFIVAQADTPLPDSTGWKPVFSNSLLIIYETHTANQITAPAHP